MKNQELFVKSVDILVDAFDKGKLKHMSACNCAVGNLIAYNTGKYISNNDDRANAWVHLLNLIREKSIANIHPHTNGIKKHFKNEYKSKDAFDVIKHTGYTANEIERIEAAFEKCTIDPKTKIAKMDSRSSDSYENPRQGLLNAVVVLGDIHEIPDDVISCMHDKILNGTYVKSFEFETPKDGTTDDEKAEEIACTIIADTWAPTVL